MAQSEIQKTIQKRIATKLIKLLSPAIGTGAILITIIVMLSDSPQWTRVVPSLLMIIILAFNLWLVKKDKIRLATNLTFIIGYIGMLLGMIFHGGVHAPIYTSASLIILYIITWLYSMRKALLFLIILATVGGVFVWLELNNHLPPYSKISTTQIWIYVLAFNIMMITTASIPTKILYKSLTEGEKKSQELSHLQNYLSNIIDSMPSILAGVNVKGEITQWNKTAEEITGISTADALGKELTILFPEIGLEKDELKKRIAAKEIKKYSTKPRYIEKGVIYETVTIYPLVANGVQGAVVRIDDVTKEHELEKQLSHSRKMDAIGQLAGGVAHDFNNMLAGILGAAQLLKLPNRNLDERGLGYAEMIIQSVTRATSLTGKLLSFGRKGKVDNILVNIHTIINDTVSLLSSSIDKKIKIVVQQDAINYYMIGDNSALQNALMNIGINASHAMPNGGELQIITKNIRLDAHYCATTVFDIEPGQYVEIEIRDNGTGIHEKQLPKIFEPFFTTKEQGKGTGLGLAAVYGIMQDHYGAIAVYSALDQGTVFHLFFPCSEEIIDTTMDDEKIIFGSGRILLVDDEELIRITGEQMLIGMGYEVIIAENGLQAVEIFKEQHHKIDLVVMDMLMPEMNGREAFLEMKKINADCPIIIASGFTKNTNLAELGEQGLAGFIHKPFRDYKLSKLIANVLENNK